MKYEKGTIGWLKGRLIDKRINIENKSFGELIKLGQGNGILKDDKKKIGYKYKCEICGHQWNPREQNKIPIYCPNPLCHSFKWNSNIKTTWRDHTNQTIKNANCNSLGEYKDKLAQEKGYKDWNEQRKIKRWDEGKNVPVEFSTDSASYKGIHLGEEIITDPILIEIFGDIEKKMSYGNSGYDRVVKGGYKIDSKLRVLINDWAHHSYGWKYYIDYNKIADYFLLIGLDADGKRIVHIWLIHKNEMIREERFYKRGSIRISNSPNRLLEFQKYEITGRLNCINGINEILNKEGE